jgi:hypothetical protein
MKTLILNNFTMDTLSIDEKHIVKRDDTFTHIEYYPGLIDDMINLFTKSLNKTTNVIEVNPLLNSLMKDNLKMKDYCISRINKYQAELKDIEDDILVNQSMIDLFTNGDTPHSSSHMIFIDHGNVSDKRNIYDPTVLETRVTLSSGSVDNQGSFMDMIESGPSDTGKLGDCDNCDDKDNCPNYNDLSDDNVGDDLSGVPGQSDVDGGYSDMKD